MPIQQKLPSPVFLFNDFDDWDECRATSSLKDTLTVSYSFVYKNSVFEFAFRSYRNTTIGSYRKNYGYHLVLYRTNTSPISRSDFHVSSCIRTTHYEHLVKTNRHFVFTMTTSNLVAQVVYANQIRLR